MKIKKTVIFMGYSCNNNCIFCCNSERRKTIHDESTREIKNKILAAKKEGTTYLELIGGEPTIRKDIIELVKFAKDLDFETIAFASNGRMLSIKKFAENIIKAGVNHIIFSIHSHNDELHDALTGVPGSFNQLIKGINNIQDLGFNHVGSNTTIVKQNYKDLLSIGKMIYSLGIRNSEFIFVDPTRGFPKTNFDDLVPTYDEVSPFVNKLLEFGEKNKISHWHVRYYPLCFVNEKYHNMISEVLEKKIFDTEHVAPDFVSKNVEKGRETVGRVKTIECNGCEYFVLCEGYWKEYVNQMNPKK